jgi:transcription elongation factor GreA
MFINGGLKMETKQYTFTRSYKKMLEDELIRRETVEADRIKAAVAEARAQGDLSENADYSAAREAQSENEAKIVELENIIKNHKIIENTTITVEYVDLKKSYTFKVVGTSEADPKNGKISKESPLGRAIVGKRVGSVFTFTSEAGKEMKVKLLKKN